jgi:lipopolysaccharide transport system permease protein
VATAATRASRGGGVAADEAWSENRPSRGWLPQGDVQELWKRRELVFFLALRDFKLRYTQAVLGAAWVLIQPLAGAAIFYGVFGQVLGVPSDGIPYLVFVYAGLAVWAYVSNAVEAAAESLAAHSALVTKVYFPRLAAPVAAVLPGLVDLAIALVVLGVLMAAYGVAPSVALVTLPLWILATIAITLAVGLWLSALNAQYRDVRYALSFLLQIWFFASPVVFPSSLISGAWKYVYALNPLVGVLDGFRWSVLDGPAPGSQDLVSLAVGVLLFLTGVVYFRRVERRLADVI